MEKESAWKNRCLDLEKRYLDLEKRYLVLEKRCEELISENQMLREKLNTNSKNSSKPPSQDPFKKGRSSKPTGKKPGGQPGHPGHKRRFYSANQVTKTINLYPTTCPNCSGTSFGQMPISVEIRQVIELPEMPPEVNQYQIHTCKCTCCSKSVRADVPKEAERGFGPRLMGFLTMLTAEGHLSKRKICKIAEHLGVKISLGALCNIYKLATNLLQEPHEAIRDHVLEAKNVNADETSWSVLGKRCWVWIGATTKASFFKIDPSRSIQAYLRIFGKFDGTLITDRYSAYNQHIGSKQSCLAHIDRYFVKMSQRPGIDGSLGRILEQQLDQIFGLWKSFKENEFSREELQRKAVELVENIKVSLMFAAQKAKDRKSQALAYDLLGRFETLWTFLYETGVEPTNNLAERGLRSIVIFRKLSQGSQSIWGAEFIERIMTVACTLKQNSRNLFRFLTELFEAHQMARPPPSLSL